MNLKIQQKQTLSSALLLQWIKLWEKTPTAHFYNSPEWFLTWKDLHKNKEFTIIAAYDSKELVGILPLVKDKRFGISVYTQPNIAVSDKASVLTRSHVDITHHHMLQYAAKNVSFYLPEVDEAYMKSVICSKGMYIREASLNAYIPLSQDPFSYIDKKQWNKIRNKQKRYDSNLSYKVYKGDMQALSVVYDIENRSFKKKKGLATFSDITMREFMDALIKRAPQQVEIDILTFDTVPVVASIGFKAKNTFHAFYTAYDASYRFLSPGKLLLFYMMQRLLEEGAAEIDLGREYNTLKKEFTPFYRSQYDIFATQRLFVPLWWNIMNSTYSGVVHNKYLYGTYCALKKITY